MKKILLILFFLILNGKNFPQETEKIVEIEKERYFGNFNLKKINYSGDTSYDVTHYKLNLILSHTPNYLSGEVTVTARSLINDLPSFFLDLSNVLTVDSVKSNNQNLTFAHEENKLTIFPDLKIFINEEYTVTIFYQGIPQTSGLGSFVFDNQPSIWTLSQPYGASDWWPCKDSPADKADSSDIWITCSSNFYAVSNGSLTEIIDNNNGNTTYKWKSSYPIAHYLISLAIADYKIYQQYFNYSPKDSMQVVHYIYPEIFTEIKDQLDKTIPMLEIFSERFGPYPFLKEKYGHASFGRGGMEHQTVSSMGIFTDGVISHELAHQWFGDKITCKDWNNIWLNEGFATFSEGVYIEAVSGKDAYNSFISSQMSRAKTAGGSLYVQNIGLISEIFNGARSYSKGAVVLHMLRGITGDSLFFRILRNYLNDPELAYRTAVTEDFQRHAEAVYGSSLDYFFQQWIYGENYPQYYVKWNYTELENNIFEINLSIDQADNTYPRFFIMPLQVKIPTSVKDTVISFFNNLQNQSFKFYIEGEPTNFIFDPDNLVLKDVLITDPRDFTVPAAFRLKQNYPNPFNLTTVISWELPVRSFVAIKVFSVLGNEISTIYNEEAEAGEYEVKFDASSLGSGIYFYRIYTFDPESGSGGIFIETKKMVYIK